MKRNKKAFTLAEVSIAMAVIGIVATLILPLVVKNVQKLQTGPMLGRILEQIETGNQNIINLANSNYVATTGSYVDSLEVIDCADIGFNCTGTVAKNFIDIAPAFWGLNTTDIPKEDVLPIKKLDGTSDNNDYSLILHQDRRAEAFLHNGRLCRSHRCSTTPACGSDHSETIGTGARCITCQCSADTHRQMAR